MLQSKSTAQHNIATVLGVLLVALYASVPSNPLIFGVPSNASWMVRENIYGSVILGILLLVTGYQLRAMPTQKKSASVNDWFSIVVFIMSSFWLSANGWIETREGPEAFVAAIFRVLWFCVILNQNHGQMTNTRRGVLILASSILMFLDQSRTYFLISLLILIVGYKKTFAVPLIAAAIATGLFVAALRSDENLNFIYAMTFAIGGEGYLGSLGVFQVLGLPEDGLNYSVPAVMALTAPLSAPVVLIFKRLGYETGGFDSSSYLGDYIKFLSGDTYPPMGGFYILSEFMRAGFFGFLCMAIYVILVLVITKRLFDTVDVPAGSFISIIAIKASPSVYWNLVMSIFIISYTLRFLIIYFDKK
jgi:hypothetical protein